MSSLLDNLPMGTILSLAGVGVAIVGYLNGDLSVFEALAACGVTTFGAGKLGEARARSGKGLSKHLRPPTPGT